MTGPRAAPAQTVTDGVRFADLREKLELKGYLLARADDGFIVGKYGLVKFLDTLDDVAKFARQAGAA